MLHDIQLDRQNIKPARIVVIGVGGGGSNAVQHMMNQNLEECELAICNTDAQAIQNSQVPNTFLLGQETTRGLGAGGNPEIGRKAAEESLTEIEDFLDGADMVFLSVGMGGGTGTGASPVIAKMIQEKGITCIGVVSKPFAFESTKRMQAAEKGIAELQQFVDTLIVIPNNNLYANVGQGATFLEALEKVDEILLCGVQAIANLMIRPGKINLDFNDVRAIVQNSGRAIIGIGQVSKSEHGDETAELAAKQAISNALLEYNNIGQARAVLVNVTASENLSFMDMSTVCNTVREAVHPDANVIVGMSLNNDFDSGVSDDIISLSVLATGISEDETSTIHSQIEQTVIPKQPQHTQTQTHIATPDASSQNPEKTPQSDNNPLQFLDNISPVQSVTSEAPPSLTGGESSTPHIPETETKSEAPSVSSEEQASIPEESPKKTTPKNVPIWGRPSEPSAQELEQTDILNFKTDISDTKNKKSVLFGGFFNKKTPQDASTNAMETNTTEPDGISDIPDFLKNQKD